MANLPVSKNYTVTAAYGQKGSYWKNGHLGIDFVTADRVVYATADGIVRVAAYDSTGWGNYLSVGDGDGLRHLYCHLEKTEVKVGQQVKAGQRIAVMGKTGNATGVHLHYQINNSDGIPQNPAEFLKIQNKVGEAVDLSIYKDDGEIAKFAKSAVYAVRAADIMIGDPDGYFRPEQPLSRQEAAVIIAKLLEEK